MSRLLLVVRAVIGCLDVIGRAGRLQDSEGGSGLLRSDGYDFGSGAALAGALSVCVAVRSAAGASLDFSPVPHLLRVVCVVENFLKDIKNAFQFCSNDLLLL